MKVFLANNINPYAKKSCTNNEQKITFAAGFRSNRNLLRLPQDTFSGSGKDVKYYRSLLKNSVERLPKFNKDIPIVNFKIGQKKFIGNYFEHGAVKAVYEFNNDRKKEVICLPFDHYKYSWDEVFSEPENTQEIRKLGLLVNDVCEIQPVEIDNVLFPALRMRHYSEHDFKIYDPKNFRDDAPKLDEIIDIKNVTVEELEEMLSGVVADINTIVKNDVHLCSDSFCFAKPKDGKLRLYFNDLGAVPGKESIFNQSISKKENAKDQVSKMMMQFFYAFDGYRGCSPFAENLEQRLLSKINI